MPQSPEFTRQIAHICLLAGKIMLQNGAETYRVEDTMTRIARSFGLPGSHSFVTPTGIIFTIEGTRAEGADSFTSLSRITSRSTDLRKVMKVNAISRQIGEGGLSAPEAYRLLRETEISAEGYSLRLKTAAAALASGCFLIMFHGGWSDFVPAMAAGGGGYLTLQLAAKRIPVRLFGEFAASFILGCLAWLFVAIGWGRELDAIVIGSVMPLVPGVLITNAVRDLMAGHFVSGLSKGAEALFTALAIGAGIAIVLSLRGMGA
ncbi:threonine/serine exporter family protein [Cohnella massiliensis]|uniref:threonine/serine exporter family protein n=1 Tax=Cohnella massiliensis TaxID=1816691 RepID=UPI0009BAE766|nr:threonine/serine exporter family protein [Cohnella massiliensis]